MKQKTPTFAIIGCGRFGSFWGKHLSNHVPVTFFDMEESRKDAILPFGNWAPLTECLKKDVVFLTIPIRHIGDFLKTHASEFAQGTTVIDCASVKIAVVEWFRDYLPENVNYVASHPLFGPDSGAGGISGQKITISPGRIPFRNYQFLVNLFEKMGLLVISMTPEEHDKLMAHNLSLIHHLGRTFHFMQIDKLSLVMANLDKMNWISRVASNDSLELFQDFYRYNPYAEVVRDNFLANFHKISSKIYDRDTYLKLF